MLKAINLWTFPGSKPFGRAGKSPLTACMAEAKKAGFEAIELAIDETGELTGKATKTTCKRLRAAAEDIGIQIGSTALGLLWGCPVTANSARTRKKGTDLVKRGIERTAWLGTDCMLVIPGVVGVDFMSGVETVSYDVAYNRALEAWTTLGEFAAKHGVVLGLENVWNKFLLSPLEMRDLVDTINSPGVGVYFDIGNVIINGYPEQWIHILGDRIKRIHVKDFRRDVGTIGGFVFPGEGDVDYAAVMAELRATGYTGPLTVEHGARSQAGLGRLADALAELMAK